MVSNEVGPERRIAAEGADLEFGILQQSDLRARRAREGHVARLRSFQHAIFLVLGFLALSGTAQSESASGKMPASERIAKEVKFSGQWAFEGTADIGNQSYRVAHHLNLFQRHNRVCGCEYRIGAPLDRIEYSLVVGRIAGDIVDIFTDAGDSATPPGEYKIAYPIQPYLFGRYRLRGNTLHVGIVDRLAEQVSRRYPSLDQTSFLENDFALRRKSTNLNEEACSDGANKNAWRNFLARCLSDQGPVWPSSVNPK